MSSQAVNRSYIGLAVLLIMAFMIRMGYILEIRDEPHTYAPAVDAGFHDLWAKRVAAGDPGDRPFFRAPLYPWLLGITYKAFGDSPFPPRILQALMSTLTVWLLWCIGRRLFGSTAGWISAITFTVFGLAIFFAGELLITTFIVFLDTVILWLVIKNYRTGRWWQWGIIGLVIGLSAIARPSILIFLPVLLIAIWAAGKQVSARIKVVNTVSVFLGLVIPIMPVTLTNRIGGGEWVLIATQGGINFYIGNNPEATGAHSILPEFGETWELSDAWNLAMQETGQSLTSTQLSNFYYKKALRWILHHPLDWLKLTARKTHLFIQQFEISNNRNIYFFSNRSIILKFLMLIGFGVVAPIGILGMIFNYRHSGESRIIIWFIISYSMGVILFFITSRFRMPVVPGLIVLGSVVPIQIYRWLRDKKYRMVISASIGGVILYAVCWWNPYGFTKKPDAQVYFSLGNAYLKLQRYSEARDTYRTALLLDPTYEWVHLNIGVSHLRQGNIAGAAKEYRMELELYPESVTAMNNLGALAHGRGDYQEAIDWFRRALAIKPYYNDAKVNLAETLFQQGYVLAQDGKFSDARLLFEEAADLAPNRAIYRYNLAVMLAATGDSQAANQHWDIAHQIDPTIPGLPEYAPLESNESDSLP